MKALKNGGDILNAAPVAIAYKNGAVHIEYM